MTELLGYEAVIRTRSRIEYREQGAQKFGSSFRARYFYRDYEVSATQRGRPKLIHKGFSYTAHIIYKNDPYKYWHCDQRWKGCKVRGVLVPDGRLSLRGTHNHRPKKQSVLMVLYPESKDSSEMIVKYSQGDE
ncbi:hypothetical protein RUM44_009669 [Polyplax serrata]|uniref:FLYWCH-type domain-containing protein n=1 Tax=Polyplax serrata TaxID=468196 RepID=A0ABR1ATD0_POLSC